MLLFVYALNDAYRENNVMRSAVLKFPRIKTISDFQNVMNILSVGLVVSQFEGFKYFLKKDISHR